MGLLSGFDNSTGWAILQKNTPAIEIAYASTTSSASDIAYFKSVAPTLTSPQALLSNYRALKVVTTAYGLGSEVDQTAILRDLMTQDPNSTSSLAQQLADPAYLKFAQALSTWSPPPFSTQSGIDSVVSGYQESSFESSVGQDNGALQEALYFSKNAVGLTQLSQIMADKPLLDVVTTALGIPAAFGSLDYDQQVAILKPRLDMSQFATAGGVSSFITKYLAMDQLQQSTSGADPDPILSLFNNAGSSTSSTGLSLTTASFSSGALNLMA